MDHMLRSEETLQCHHHQHLVCSFILDWFIWNLKTFNYLIEFDKNTGIRTSRDQPHVTNSAKSKKGHTSRKKVSTKLSPRALYLFHNLYQFSIFVNRRFFMQAAARK